MARSYYKMVSGTVYTTDYPAHDDTKLSNAEGKRQLQQQAKDQLQTMLKPGQTVYGILRHVSASGMQRRISLAIIDGDRIQTIDYWASLVLGWKQHDKGGLIVDGCGMDMGFHTVYELSGALFRGQPEAGYNLKHSWL